LALACVVRVAEVEALIVSRDTTLVTDATYDGVVVLSGAIHWNSRGPGGPISSGLYLFRLETSGRSFIRGVAFVN